MDAVAIRLLGGFEVRRPNGEILEVPGRKDRALLAALASPLGAPQSRGALAGLLWGGSGESRARDSLKHALARLRAGFGGDEPGPFVADRTSVRLNPAAVAVDVATFEQMAKLGTPDALEQAVELYRGDLLEGTEIRDPAFEDWLIVERQRLHNLAELAAATLMSNAIASGGADRAARAARRLLHLDPLREDACRALMQIHADLGETAQALRLYDDLRVRLREQLGVSPDGDTTRLHDGIRRGRKVNDMGGLVETRFAPRSVPTLPDRPSIAVLAFRNLSGDPEQDYFSDGVVEEIITALSRIRWLFVIARNSSFAYRGRPADIRQIGQELGVRYALEGSLRKAADRVRMTAHLIEAASGAQLWADSFEGQTTDIFDLQDQITSRVVGALAPQLEKAEIERARRKPTESLDAYDYFLRGLAEVHKWKRQANVEALHLFTRATELDPEFATAWGMAARCLSQRKASGWVVDRHAEVQEVRRLARRAVELGADDAVALAGAAIGLAFVAGETGDGGALLKRALGLNPNLAMAWLFSGWVNVWNGEQEAALQQLGHAMRLSPHDPQIAMMEAATACAHFFAARDEDAMSWATTAVRSQPGNRIATCILAAAHAGNGDLDKAAATLQRLREIDPALRISELPNWFPIQRPEDLRRWAEALRLAGLPE